MAEEAPRSLFERITIPIASSRPGSWLFVNVAPYLDRPLMKLTGGRLSLAGFNRVGILRVKGAKSGIERETPLVFTNDGDNVLLVASRGGDIRHPAWYRNLVANPEVIFSDRRGDRPFVARELDGDERERAWRLVNRTYPGFTTYQKRAGARLIPVMVLEPR